MKLKSSLVVLSIVVLATSDCQSTEAEQKHLSNAVRNRNDGRSLFDFGIFRKISQFFGWGNENRKSSRQYPFYYKRPEILPYELQHSPNRRSGLEPPSDVINYQKNKWPPTRLKSKSHNKLRLKNYFNKERFHNRRYSTFKPYGNYKSINSFVNKNKYNNIMKNFVDESINLKELPPKPFEEKKQKESQIINQLPQAQPLKAAKVESREPVITVYNNGIKSKAVSSAYDLKSSASVVHSQFALKNYVSNKDQQTSRPQIKISLNSNRNNNLVTASKTAQEKKDKEVPKKYIQEQTNPVHPYPYVKPNAPLAQTQMQNKNIDDDPIIAQGHGPEPIYANPVRGNIIKRKKKVKKERGIIENMSNFANNIFGNIFSRSSDQTPSSSQTYPQRRRQRNPPLKFIPPSEDSIPLPSSLKGKSSDPFTPSPQQGIMSIDAFQPIFVPSYSMDSKLPSDVMKPLILPEKRLSEVSEEEAPKEPELINFFS